MIKKRFISMLALLITAATGAWADEVTFSASDLKATLPSGNTNIAVPYEWKESSDQVTVTIAKTGWHGSNPFCG